MSGILSSEDTANIQAALADVRADRAESIAIRRGNTTKTAQSMRIERTARGRWSNTVEASERRADAVVHMATDADIEVGDRFNDSSGVLYEVSFIRPNRSMATFAEAVVIE